MDYETIRIIQGYAYWAITILLVILLYGYIYQKYARLALDDNLNDDLVEARSNKDKKKES